MRLLASRSPRVSLVSPVYGVAPYLPRFLDSLSAQDHPHDRLQVVLVLDGACDDSPSICRTWAAATDIDALVIETGNGGQGRARNLALARADGAAAREALAADRVQDRSIRRRQERAEVRAKRRARPRARHRGR